MFLLREKIPIKIGNIECVAFVATQTKEEMAEVLLKIGGNIENVMDVEMEVEDE